MGNEIECLIDLDENWVKSVESRLATADGSTAPTPRAIFRVPEYMRATDPMAYEPRIVAIGPYHHGKPHLLPAEKLKLHFVNLCLRRGTGRTLRDYLKQMKELEPRARAAYADPVDMDSNAFVQMLLFDACFVLEVICSSALGQQVFEGSQNTITNNLRSPTVVARDMLLLENQLPYFLLEALFDSLFPPEVPEAGRLRDWALQCVSTSGVKTALVGSDRGNIANSQHILHLFHSRITSAGSARLDQPDVNNSNFSSLKREEEEPSDLPLRWIPRATEMKAAGVQLRKKNNVSNFLDVTFDNGKMEIPQLEVDDDTNALLRNLIAFEQCYQYVHADVTAYASLFACIIDTVEDVALLKRRDIIASGLGSNEQVADLFNKLYKDVTLDHATCYLSRVFRDVKMHCKRRPNQCFAEFKRKFFDSPSFLGMFIVAILLFLITIAEFVIVIQNFRSQH